MSWQAATMLALAVVLVAGMVWYERSRPPSQVIALVAALAALAVAGRVALAPIPNVVPTTDIALISGYALGPAPGFAVGSLAALVSNFWLGQGPWTPWQMAGWGMCGIGGALLAVGFARRLGRVGLAVACAAAGFAYGALLDLSLMVTYGGEQSLDRFLALSARGLPFNVAHAAGNAALALIAGPALVRMLVRYRERFEFAWSRPSQPLRPLRHRRAPRPGAAAGAGCLLAATVAIALASGEIARGAGGNPGDARAASGGVGAAVDWLRGAQNTDGGFGTDPGEASSPEMTGWAMLGLAAARVNPLDVSRDGRNPVAYLRSTADRIRTTGDIERTLLALAAAGVDPDGIGGGLVPRLRNRRGRDGSWGRQVNLTAFGVLALRAAGEGSPASVRWLVRRRNDDGGWGFSPGAASDADSTGAAMQGIAAGGGSRRALRRGAAWLRGAQRRGGGFALMGGPVNAQSTAWAIQGLLAAGVAPESVRRGGRSPLGYLAAVQAADGHYRYSASFDQTPVWVTGQALAAVSLKSFPLAEVAREATTPRAAAAPASERQGDGKAGRQASKRPDRPAAAKERGGVDTAYPPDDPPTAPRTPFASPLDQTAAESGEAGSDQTLTWVLIGLLGLLAAGLAGGWLLYRRRLPSSPVAPPE